MKKIHILLYIIILGLIFTIIITPFEARALGQELNWMYKINLKEYFIFALSLSLGIVIGKRLNSMALEKGLTIQPRLPIPKSIPK